MIRCRTFRSGEGAGVLRVKTLIYRQLYALHGRLLWGESEPPAIAVMPADHHYSTSSSAVRPNQIDIRIAYSDHRWWLSPAIPIATIEPIEKTDRPDRRQDRRQDRQDRQQDRTGSIRRSTFGPIAKTHDCEPIGFDRPRSGSGSTQDRAGSDRIGVQIAPIDHTDRHDRPNRTRLNSMDLTDLSLLTRRSPSSP